MPKFAVSLEERVRYVVEIEAEDEEQASELAVEKWCQSENPDSDFNGEGQGVNAYFVYPRK